MDASNFQFLLKPQRRKTVCLRPFYKNCCLIIEFSCKAYMTYDASSV